MRNKASKQLENEEKQDYYSLDRILATDSDYNVIYGKRSNGKTYSVLLHALEDYVRTGGQLALVRRWREDVIGHRGSAIYEAINSDGHVLRLTDGKYKGVAYKAGRFYLCNYDDEGKAVIDSARVLGYLFALSNVEHDKSTAYPNVTNILFDEFIAKSVYFDDEFVTFMNVVSTIVRQRGNVKIFMCGNTVNKFCPYIKEMGLTRFWDMKQGDIDTYNFNNGLKIAVEYCKDTKPKDSNKYFEFDNPKLKMITHGEWELDTYPKLPERYDKSQIICKYFILFEGLTFQCNIIKGREGVFTYVHRKTTPIKQPLRDYVFCLDNVPLRYYNKDITRPVNKITEWFLWFFKHDRVYYQNDDIANYVNEYLIQCRG